jgi:hypothetical protein
MSKIDKIVDKFKPDSYGVVSPTLNFVRSEAMKILNRNDNQKVRAIISKISCALFSLLFLLFLIGVYRVYLSKDRVSLCEELLWTTSWLICLFLICAVQGYFTKPSSKLTDEKSAAIKNIITQKRLENFDLISSFIREVEKQTSAMERKQAKIWEAHRSSTKLIFIPILSLLGKLLFGSLSANNLTLTFQTSSGNLGITPGFVLAVIIVLALCYWFYLVGKIFFGPTLILRSEISLNYALLAIACQLIYELSDVRTDNLESNERHGDPKKSLEMK